MSKKKNPTFSIITPVYKRRELAKQSIESVLRQKSLKRDSVEIIIVEDEDDMETRKENKEFYESISKKVLYYINTNKEGPGGARQTGLAKARGKYVAFLDSDDRMRPTFLVEMKDALDKSDAVAAICLSKSVFESGVSRKEKLKLPPLIFIRDLALYLAYIFNKKNIFPPAFYLCQISHMCFKKKVIERQKFNYDFRRGGEDWDFFVQTLEKGNIRIVLKKLLFFRYSPGSSTDTPINRKLKWQSYSLLAKRLPERYKKGLFYKLFLYYIGLFGGKDVIK